MENFDLTLLFLVAPILGVTAAMISMFPKTLGAFKPVVAFVVALALYYAWLYLDPKLLGLLIATGSAMGLYELKKG